MSEPPKKVLSDHKRVEKKLLPPWSYSIGNLDEISWRKNTIPEIIWLGLLNNEFGFREGARLSLVLPQLAQKFCSKPFNFSLISSYQFLDDSEKIALVNELGKTNEFPLIKQALDPLLRFYPLCPINFLSSLSKETYDSANHGGLKNLKTVLFSVYKKTSTEAILMQSNALYIEFVSGRLKVTKGLALSEFPEVENYPKTEKSMRVAASVRSTLNIIVGTARKDFPTNWQSYFWNRGIELEACTTEVEVE